MPQVVGGDVRSCVIDSEAVAWDTEKQQILPFQILSTRKRKVLNTVPPSAPPFLPPSLPPFSSLPLFPCDHFSPALLPQDADIADIKVQVCVYAFDLLYLNGRVSASHNGETGGVGGGAHGIHVCHFYFLLSR